MSIVTKYICDRCAYEQPTAEQMWKLEFFLEALTGRSRDDYKFPRNSVMWCRKCCEEFGALQVPGKMPPEAQKPFNLEDMLREVIREEIFHATGA